MVHFLKDDLTTWIIEGSNRNLKIRYSGKESDPYIVFNGRRYKLREFLRTQGVWTYFPVLHNAGYHGILQTSYFDGLLVSVADDGDSVKCFTYRVKETEEQEAHYV